MAKHWQGGGGALVSSTMGLPDRVHGQPRNSRVPLSQMEVLLASGLGEGSSPYSPHLRTHHPGWLSWAQHTAAVGAARAGLQPAHRSPASLSLSPRPGCLPSGQSTSASGTRGLSCTRPQGLLGNRLLLWGVSTFCPALQPVWVPGGGSRPTHAARDPRLMAEAEDTEGLLLRDPSLMVETSAGLWYLPRNMH